MQPQDPYGPPQGYSPQGQSGKPPDIPQPQIPGQQSAPGYAVPVQQQPGQPAPGSNSYLPPMPAYQPPASAMANKNTPSEPNYASTPDAPTTPYDFFMAPKQAASGRPLPVGGKLLGTRPGAEGGSNTKRIVFFAAGGAIAIIGVIMAIIAFSPKDPAGVQLFDIAQTQQELIRVCGLGTINGKSQTTRNFSVTCSTGITGDQTTLLAYMKKTGVDYDPKLLAAKKSAQIDAKLAQASSSSTYDSTYDTVVEAQLATYNRALTSQLGTTTSATGRAVLTKSQKDAELLVKMLNGSN